MSFISITNNKLSAALALPAVPNINLKASKNVNYNPITRSFSQGSSTASPTSASCSIRLDQGDPRQRIDKGDKISNVIYKKLKAINYEGLVRYVGSGSIDLFMRSLKYNFFSKYQYAYSFSSIYERLKWVSSKYIWFIRLLFNRI